MYTCWYRLKESSEFFYNIWLFAAFLKTLHFGKFAIKGPNKKVREQ